MSAKVVRLPPGSKALIRHEGKQGQFIHHDGELVLLPAADYDAMVKRLRLAEEALQALDTAASYCQCEGGACEHSRFIGLRLTKEMARLEKAAETKGESDGT
jgi:hypothetical protein